MIAFYISLAVSAAIAFIIIVCVVRKNPRRRRAGLGGVGSTFGKMRAEQIPEEVPMMLNTADSELDDEL